MSRLRVLVAILLMTATVRTASAQSTSSQPPQPADSPSITVGATIFADWTVQTTPKTTDTDGNSVTSSAFNVARSYININGKLSPLISFRVTPDIVRETNPASAATGSLVFRLKYAYAQFSFDQWMEKGTWARFGIHQMPWLDFIEGIYRYRFQGTLYPEREGYFASADAGVSFHTELPREYGDVHVGYYNGESFQRSEVNDQKAFMIRGTVRPFAAAAPVWRGFRATAFYDSDRYVKDAPRTRFMSALTFQHPHVHAGLEYLNAHDQQSATTPALSTNVNGRGYSMWVTPRTSKGWEGLVRYDHHTPNLTFDARTSA